MSPNGYSYTRTHNPRDTRTNGGRRRLQNESTAVVDTSLHASLEGRTGCPKAGPRARAPQGKTLEQAVFCCKPRHAVPARTYELRVHIGMILGQKAAQYKGALASPSTLLLLTALTTYSTWPTVNFERKQRWYATSSPGAASTIYSMR